MTGGVTTSLRTFSITKTTDGAGVRPMISPILFGAVAAGAAHLLGAGPAFTDAGSTLSAAGTIASVAATMLGFMLAALAVLASISHTHLVQMMQRSGHYADLVATLLVGCVIFLLCAIAGFVVVFGLKPTQPYWTAVIGAHAAAVASLIDVGRKFALVLMNLRPVTPT